LRCDIRKFFANIDHQILKNILEKYVLDKDIIKLLSKLIDSFHTENGKGLPLGNLTSQFFANIYLNELDQFVKHRLRAKYYIRYVDDFVILSEIKEHLIEFQEKIDGFLIFELRLSLHPDKSKILTLDRGINFLGFRLFYYYKLLRKKNMNKFYRKFLKLKDEYYKNKIDRDYARERVEGWLAYATHGNTYKYRKQLLKNFNKYFPNKPTIQSLNLKIHNNFLEKMEKINIKYSQEKTLEFL
jgi:hypothetical protein